MNRAPVGPAISRRAFVRRAVPLILAGPVLAADSAVAEPVIDIHQHTRYSGRTNAQLARHQQVMGVTHTVLLPAGSWYGLDAFCGGNDTVLDMAREHPVKYFYFANEVPDLVGARVEIEKYLRRGAVGIGEQKFRVDSDSREVEQIAEIAQSFQVPVLLHFQHEVYNRGLERFHKILEKFPKVNFIGHAQTWWANIDKNHEQKVLYPKTSVTAGGITDRLLKEYPNMFGDMSAGSGLNSMIRDEEHARGFLDRHQSKLFYGSDCDDVLGRGPGCQGFRILEAIRRLAPNKAAERKILFENARRVLKLPI